MDKSTLQAIMPDAIKRDRFLSDLEDFLQSVESAFAGGYIDLVPGYEALCQMRDDLYELIPEVEED